MTGEEKAREIADKLRKEKETGKQNSVVPLTESTMAAVMQNAEMAKMYSESASIGSDNLGGELPLLKIHSVGKSTTNELADGSEPKDGYFFYKPTAEQFETVRCHILSISKGFRSKGVEEGTEVFNQILSGEMIGESGEFKPFMMYMTGMKLAPMWEFGKVLSKYTHAKPLSIPMFAMTVKLTAKKSEKHSFGKSWIVDFELEKNADGSPVLVVDPGEFQYLRDSAQGIEEVVEHLIYAKTNKAGTAKPVEPALPGGNGVEEIPF